MAAIVTSSLIEFTASFEGLKLNAYRDGAGIWTIGAGSRVMLGGAPVREGDTVTLDQARMLLANELRTALSAVLRLTLHPLTQAQCEACADFAFNVGVGNFSNSTLLKLINLGKLDQAADEFLKWDKDAAGNVEPGLQRRREAERARFLG